MGPRAYVSGALTNVADPAATRALYVRIAQVLRSEGYDPYLPHTTASDPVDHPEAAPVDVYAADVRAIAASHLVVACLGAPSLGVGAELAIACSLGVPVVAVYPSGAPVSRFALGLVRTHGCAEVVADGADWETDLRDAVLASRDRQRSTT
jgi:2'-deoxynucleoside 5'-phosphate N-hydrolase